MDPAALLGRLLPVITLAAALTAPGVPQPAAEATASCVAGCDVDTDGDGLPDLGDGCPTVASTNPTGCPTAPREAALKWREGRNRLQARITSPVRSCASRARINLWRVRPNRDFKVLQATATSARPLPLQGLARPDVLRHRLAVVQPRRGGVRQGRLPEGARPPSLTGHIGAYSTKGLTTAVAPAYLLFNQSVEEGAP